MILSPPYDASCERNEQNEQTEQHADDTDGLAGFFSSRTARSTARSTACQAVAGDDSLTGCATGTAPLSGMPLVRSQVNW